MQFIDVYFKDYIYNINKEEFEKKALYSCFKDGILLSEKLDELVSLDSDTVRNFVDFLNGKGKIIDTSNAVIAFTTNYNCKCLQNFAKYLQKL